MVYPRRLILYISVFYHLIGGNGEEGETVRVEVCDVIFLKCPFIDKNAESIEWNQNKSRIMIYDVNNNTTKTFGGSSFVLKNGNGISILELNVNNSEKCGRYDCVTYSRTGSSKKITWLIRLGKEGDVGANLTVVTSVGKYTGLNCTWATSSPPTEVMWMKGDNVILKHDVASTSNFQGGKYTSHIEGKTASLEVSVAGFNDSGVYNCFLSYPFYKKKRPAARWILQVQGKY